MTDNISKIPHYEYYPSKKITLLNAHIRDFIIKVYKYVSIHKNSLYEQIKGCQLNQPICPLISQL